MKILVANHSSYPPAFESPQGQAPPSQLARVLCEVIRDQERTGIDIVTDGQVSWTDPVSHLLRHLDGVRLGEPEFFLDSNLQFRPAIIQAKLRHRATPTLAEYRQAREVSDRVVKPVLIGPYTLARSARIATTAYRTVADLAADLSIVLAQEVHDLAQAGASLVQIEEPLLLRHGEDVRLARELLEPLKVAAGDSTQLAVATYLGDAEPLYAQLNSLPADVIAVDLVGSPRLADVIADTGSGKILALGVTDGLSAGMEESAILCRRIERVLSRYIHDVVHIQPSCGLAPLSRTQARATLALLSRVRDTLAS